VLCFAKLWKVGKAWISFAEYLLPRRVTWRWKLRKKPFYLVLYDLRSSSRISSYRDCRKDSEPKGLVHCALKFPHRQPAQRTEISFSDELRIVYRVLGWPESRQYCTSNCSDINQFKLTNTTVSCPHNQAYQVESSIGGGSSTCTPSQGSALAQ
jgi:hypothetical protein